MAQGSRASLSHAPDSCTVFGGSVMEGLSVPFPSPQA